MSKYLLVSTILYVLVPATTAIVLTPVDTNGTAPEQVSLEYLTAHFNYTDDSEAPDTPELPYDSEMPYAPDLPNDRALLDVDSYESLPVRRLLKSTGRARRLLNASKSTEILNSTGRARRLLNASKSTEILNSTGRARRLLNASTSTEILNSTGRARRLLNASTSTEVLNSMGRARRILGSSTGNGTRTSPERRLLNIADAIKDIGDDIKALMDIFSGFNSSNSTGHHKQMKHAMKDRRVLEGHYRQRLLRP